MNTEGESSWEKRQSLGPCAGIYSSPAQVPFAAQVHSKQILLQIARGHSPSSGAIPKPTELFLLKSLQFLSIIGVFDESMATA